MTEPTLQEAEAKRLLGYLHRIGVAMTAFESELQGTPALTPVMKEAIMTMKCELQHSQQEIVDLRDGKA